MQPTKPYLIRAIHEWCVDQGFTPYLAVSVDASTRVPREFVKDGEIVLNVGHDATHQMSLGNEEITFQARFGGRPYPVVVPIERVLAIYARENGQGMAFEATEVGADAESDVDTGGAKPESELHVMEGLPLEAGDSDASSPRPPPGKPRLTRVK